MGTWYAGDLLDVSDWPVNRTASLAGMAVFNMFKSFHLFLDNAIMHGLKVLRGMAVWY